MFNNILQNISRPFSRSNSNQQSSGYYSGQSHNRNDHEDDGFLLVGNTASERTTTEARNFNSDVIDAPPNYNQVSQSYLPSYHDYLSSSQTQSPSLDVSHFPGIQHGNPNSTGSSNSCARSQASVQPQENNFSEIRTRTAISGIPFELCNSLLGGDSFSEFRNSIYQQKRFDYTLYDYDFSLERSFLQQHEGMDVSYSSD
ncbi:hypothetical protein ACF0H5_018418 [Mactra antiquata]